MISKPIFIVTFFTALNIVATFLNQMVLAYLFGTSATMDAFLVASVLPQTILVMLIGDLASALVPLLMQYKDRKQELQQLIGELFLFLSIVALLVSLLGVVGSRWALWATTDPDMPGATFDLAASIAPFIWMIVGLNFLSSFLAGVHHFYRKFSLPAISLIFPYLGMITGGLLWAPSLGVKSVVFGWLAGALLKSLILLPVLRGHGRFQFRGGFSHPGVWALCTSILPLALALLPFTLLPVIDVFWASGLPKGSISYLGYATRIVIAVTAIVVQGLYVVLFPALSEDTVNDKLDQFCSKISDAMKTVLLLIIPLAVVIFVHRIPLLVILLERGSFDQTATVGVGRVLPWYLFGMIWMAPMAIVSRGFFALRDYKTPAKLGLLSLILYVIVSGMLIPHFSYVGIGIAYAIYWPFTFVLQSYFLGSAVGRLLTREMFIVMSKTAVNSVLAGLLVVSISGWLNASLGLLAGVLVSGLSGIGMFVLLSYFAFKIPHFRMLVASVMRG